MTTRDITTTRPDVRETVDRTMFRRVVLLGTPLSLGILEIFHPTNFTPTIFQALEPTVNWWLFLHVVQLPLFGLMALAIWLLVDGLEGPAVLISRIAMGIFVIFYSAADAILGVATGILIRDSKGFSPGQKAAVTEVIQKMWSDHVGGNFSLLGRNISLIAFLGAFAWGVGVLAAIYALDRVHESRLPLVMLAGAALFFGIDHAPPFGPIGLACFFFATLYLELWGHNAYAGRKIKQGTPTMVIPPRHRGSVH